MVFMVAEDPLIHLGIVSTKDQWLLPPPYSDLTDTTYGHTYQDYKASETAKDVFPGTRGNQ